MNGRYELKKAACRISNSFCSIDVADEILNHTRSSLQTPLAPPSGENGTTSTPWMKGQRVIQGRDRTWTGRTWALE